MPLKAKASVPLPVLPQDMAAVLTALDQGTDEERWTAARAAGELPECANAIGTLLPREPNPRVREAMFTTLARIATAQSIESLLRLLRSDEASLRTGALDALRAMKGAVIPYLKNLLDDADADVRLLACELVRDMPAADATRLMCGLLAAEREANVCASAIDVLAELGTAEALPTLEQCEERFAAIPFLVFSIQTAAKRIRSQASLPRA